MFRPTLSQTAKSIVFYFEDELMTAVEGDNVAAALLRVGKIQFRADEKNNTRGPYCMMGTCFECLVEIDGKSNQQACQTVLLDGMHVRRQVAPINDSTSKGVANEG